MTYTYSFNIEYIKEKEAYYSYLKVTNGNQAGTFMYHDQFHPEFPRDISKVIRTHLDIINRAIPTKGFQKKLPKM